MIDTLGPAAPALIVAAWSLLIIIELRAARRQR